MSWNQLLSIYKEFANKRMQEDRQRPTTCPNDGEILQSGGGSTLHCPFDGYVWPEGSNWKRRRA